MESRGRAREVVDFSGVHLSVIEREGGDDKRGYLSASEGGGMLVGCPAWADWAIAQRWPTGDGKKLG